MSIFAAIEGDDHHTVERRLREAPEEVNARGWQGATPLHEAAGKGNLKILEALLEARADPSALTEAGEAPLHRASYGEMVTLLVAAGAEVDVRDTSGQTPLHRASQHGRDGSIRALLQHGASVDARNHWGETPLHCAAQEGKAGVAQLLIEAGAPIDTVALAFGNTALHKAAFRGHTAVVELLLTVGADSGLRNIAGQLPYHLAQANGHTRLAAQLLAHTPPEELGAARSVRLPPLPPSKTRALRIHPLGGGAIALMDEGRLARWDLSEPPRVSHWAQTPYSDLRDAAINPRDGTVALATESGGIEVRRWDDLSVARVIPLPGAGGASALDYSPDGRYLAVADRCEQVHLLESANGAVLATIEAPEWVGCLRFSPDGAQLAIARSWQGGGSVSIHGVGVVGSLKLLHEQTRCSLHTPAAAFVDELVHLTFTPDGMGLALFETSHQETAKPAGWRGNVVMLDTASGTVRWTTPIDGECTGDPRSLGSAGHPAGFFTQLAVMDEHLFCGANRGAVVVFASRTGKWVRNLPLLTEADVLGLAIDPARVTLWAATCEGLHHVLVQPAPTACR